ncbi:hypothetical protein B0H16DRAFT_1695882, partial [Mycena metata]
MSDQLQSAQIIGENRESRKYCIQRAGTNPETCEPWEAIWVDKSNVTHGMVEAWRLKVKQMAVEYEKQPPRIRKAPSKSRPDPSDVEAREQPGPTITVEETPHQVVPNDPGTFAALAPLAPDLLALLQNGVPRSIEHGTDFESETEVVPFLSRASTPPPDEEEESAPQCPEPDCR